MAMNTRFLYLTYAILFFISGLVFLFVPNLVIQSINELSNFQTFFTKIEISQHRFWVVLTFSMMMMVTYAAYMAYAYPNNKAYKQVLLLSKFVSSALFFVLLFVEQPAFAYLLGFLVDGSIFLSLILCYRCEGKM